MFLVPLIIGLAVGSRRSLFDNTASITLLLFLLTAFGFFLVRYPLMLLVKARNSNVEKDAIIWGCVYGAMAFGGGMALLLWTQIWALILIGLVGSGLLGIHLWLAARRMEMSVAGQWVAIAGAALAAPGAYLLFARTLDVTATMLYVLNFLFFGGTVYYIKFKVREQLRVTTPSSDWGTRLFVARAPILYSLVALFIVAIFVLLEWASVSALLAILVPLPKVLIGALMRPTRLSLPRLGIVEIGHAIVFALVMLWAWS
jgi:hypothetical protein